VSETYEPVSCSFHDTLEDAAVRRRPCRVRYRLEDGGLNEVVTTIQDVFTREGAEFARLGDGTLVRLDRLDGIEPDDSSTSGSPEGGAA
jgi:Rho-binding antiterminator